MNKKPVPASVRDYFSALGKAKGKSKARTRKQARAAARARWKKHEGKKCSNCGSVLHNSFDCGMPSPTKATP